MEPEQAHVLLPLLLVIVSLSALYVVSVVQEWIGGQASSDTRKGRDLDHEHNLGAHRHTPAWGCRKCDEAKR